MPSASALMKQGKGKQEADAYPLWGEDWVRGGFIFMDENKKREYQTVILGALLHDVGRRGKDEENNF